VGIEIRYEEPAETGGSFTYSVQHCRSGAFFDFGWMAFRPLRCRPPYTASAPLIRHGRVALAHFYHLVVGEDYIVRVHEVIQGRVVVALSLTATPADCGPDPVYYAPPDYGTAHHGPVHYGPVHYHGPVYYGPVTIAPGQGAQHAGVGHQGDNSYLDDRTIKAAKLPGPSHPLYDPGLDGP
jgi:hypothetical protein